MAKYYRKGRWVEVDKDKEDDTTEWLLSKKTPEERKEMEKEAREQLEKMVETFNKMYHKNLKLVEG